MTEEADKLSAAMEDYLEVIYFICRENQVARVGEIASRINVKKSSANAALKLLSNKGLVIHEKYGRVTLTKEGEYMASEIQDKHDILYRFLTEFLGIENGIADKEACNIEHAVSKETLLKLAKFLKFLETNADQYKSKLLNYSPTSLKEKNNVKSYKVKKKVR